MRIFEALFKVVSTRFGLRIVENSIENPHFIFCSSFQNLRLGSIMIAFVAIDWFYLLFVPLSTEGWTHDSLAFARYNGTRIQKMPS
jgi:hypothetical protein